MYFDDALKYGRKSRDFTLAFDVDDSLFERCRELGSTGIKEAIGICSYGELVAKAKDEDRSLSNYIKYKLRLRFGHE